MLKLSLLFCVLLVAPSSSFLQRFFQTTRDSDDPDVNRSVVELIESRGFVAEVHQVTTEDGYVLTMHRIINPLCNKTSPIMLQHGITASSADWIINSSDGYLNQPLSEDSGNNLGFLLAKKCYDVWLSNSRGNLYSDKHILMSKQTADYWNFSFDEMAAYDLPAFIHYILKATNSSEKRAQFIHKQHLIVFYL